MHATVPSPPWNRSTKGSWPDGREDGTCTMYCRVRPSGVTSCSTTSPAAGLAPVTKGDAGVLRKPTPTRPSRRNPHPTSESARAPHRSSLAHRICRRYRPPGVRLEPALVECRVDAHSERRGVYAERRNASCPVAGPSLRSPTSGGASLFLRVMAHQDSRTTVAPTSATAASTALAVPP